MLFGKFVLGKLFTMYEEYNQQLVKAGVLPDLKYKVRKSRETPRPRQRKAAEPAANATTSEGARAVGEELFGNIMQLLSRREIERHGGRGACHAAGRCSGCIPGPPPT